jgi:glucose uptake protein GlcU
MRRSILVFAVAMFMAGNLLTSCKSNKEKEEDAVQNIQDVLQILN